MIRQITNANFFINAFLSGVDFVDKTTNAKLIEIADTALFTRDFETVKQIASKLRDPFAASYFSNCDPFLIDPENTTKQLEALALDAPLYFQVRATKQLAGRELLTGNFSRADSLYTKSLSLCHADDPLRWLIMRDRGVLLGSAGEQEAAISILQSVLPAAWEFRHIYPSVWLDIQNNLAYELYESGRLDEAESMIKQPLRSPLIKVYPAWASTGEDIAKAKSKQSIKLFVPSTYRRPRKKKSNVVPLPLKKAVIEAVLDNSSLAGQLIQFVKRKPLSLDIGEISKEIILEIIDGRVDSSTLLKIHRMIIEGRKQSGS